MQHGTRLPKQRSIGLTDPSPYIWAFRLDASESSAIHREREVKAQGKETGKLPLSATYTRDRLP